MLLDILLLQTKLEFALIRYWTLALYGTQQTPQKSDELQQSQPSSSPSLLFNNLTHSLNTFYRPNANYGTTNLYINNRKPIKTTTAPVARKIKQKGGKNRTTPKPIYTTVMFNQFSSGKVTKNKSKPTSTNFNRLTTTMLPTTEVKAGGTKNGFSTKEKKPDFSNSNVYEKASGKASKQIKETSTISAMMKIFERYEKIQEIYPQLKPYKDNDNPTYFTVSNAKPSRENSKSFSSFVSVNSTPQKKNDSPS